MGVNIADWPGHDWAALGNAHLNLREGDAARLSSAAGFHLMGTSRRLMHISEWYHQMLLYAHLNDFHNRMQFRNSDHTNFLIDCHSFLTELGSTLDHISAYAGQVLCGMSAVGTFKKLAQQVNALPASLQPIVQKAWSDSSERLTLKHIGRYRNEIVHQRPLNQMSKDRFETVSFDLGLDAPILGVKFDIQVWPDRDSGPKFDALNSFHAMLGLLYGFGRDIISLASVKPLLTEIDASNGGYRVTSEPAKRVPYP